MPQNGLIDWNRALPFVKALKVTKQAEISPWAVFTQACHETGFFKKVIGGNNYWGIKKPRRWDGLVCNVPTHEYINGEKVAMWAEFADWDTADEAVAFYLNLLKTLYPDTLKCRNCAYCFFDGLVVGKFKWATDPSYKEKLFELYKMLNREEDIQKNFNLYV